MQHRLFSTWLTRKFAVGESMLLAVNIEWNLNKSVISLPYAILKANFIQICSSRYYFGKLFVCASLATYPYAHMLRLCRRPKFSFKYSYLSSSTLTNHLLIHRLAQSLNRSLKCHSPHGRLQQQQWQGVAKIAKRHVDTGNIIGPQ